ncbi:MAG: hypothetical protein ACFFCQ_06715 [Promethearchaeota archaeon]
MGKQPLGLLRSLIVIPDWISFAESDKPPDKKWLFQNQEIQSIEISSVIFVPSEFSRLILYNISYLVIFGAGIYWTKFSIMDQKITTDSRYLTTLVIPEEKWLDNHFNTELFVFPPPYDFMVAGEKLLEFSFKTLHAQEDLAGQSRRAFERGRILMQLVFPFKEPLVMLRDAKENNEFKDTAPMRALMCEFFNEIFVNELAIETEKSTYEENIPGIRRIKANFIEIFPKQWRTEVYLDGLRQKVSEIAKDFTQIGAPLILR